jgi:hypothetical protein
MAGVRILRDFQRDIEHQFTFRGKGFEHPDIAEIFSYRAVFEQGQE